MALLEDFEKNGNWLFRYRGVLPVVILVAGIGIYLYRRMNPGEFILPGKIPEFYFEILCLAVSLLGFFIRVYTLGHTPKNTSGGNVIKQVAGTLNTTGSYSVVRHPLYLGNFFMWLGPALLSGHIWFVGLFCLAYWIYYERIMFAEEQFLRSKFGDPYLEWANGVPSFLPRLRTFRKPEMPFSWKKALKKEKNPFAALFLIFTLINLSGELLTGGNAYNYVFLAGLGVSILTYGIVKLLKGRSKLLDDPGR